MLQPSCFRRCNFFTLMVNISGLRCTFQSSTAAQTSLSLPFKLWPQQYANSQISHKEVFANRLVGKCILFFRDRWLSGGHWWVCVTGARNNFQSNHSQPDGEYKCILIDCWVSGSLSLPDCGLVHLILHRHRDCDASKPVGKLTSVG